MRDRHLQEVRYSQLSRSYVSGPTWPLESAVDAWGSLLPIPTLCFKAGFVVCSQKWYTDETCGVCCAFFVSTLTVSLDVQMVLMCLLHTSPYQVNCPGPLPHKIIELVYFKQRLLTFHRKRWVKHTFVSWLCMEGSVILFAQQLVYHHLSGEWCCVILLVEHTNLWRTKHFTFIISNPQSMLTKIGTSFKISILHLKKWMFKEVPWVLRSQLLSNLSGIWTQP